MENPWRILEFYSGIGGMRYSLMKAGIDAEVIEAFDINDTANDVYEHNFGHRPFQGNIQSLSAMELDKYKADAWLLSPPCQPYTRQGLQKHSADARAFSFIKIIELIQHMLQPPKMFFVENVVGFETSDTHEQMLEIFGRLGFITQEFILSPLQFGIPYSRPRYFCLAKHLPLSFQKPFFNNSLQRMPSSLLEKENILSRNGHHFEDGRQEELFIPCKPIRNFMETKASYNYQAQHAEFDVCRMSGMVDPGGACIDIAIKGHAAEDEENIFNDQNGEEDETRSINISFLEKYAVPFCLIERWGNAMDIVYPDSKRCCCFTKSYYRYVKGTGSLLATSEIFGYVSTQKPTIQSLKELGLRYFTPREVANLHSFPEDFRFPEHISIRQQYALLGNSLSVAVVAPLFRYLFSEPT